MSVTWQQVLAWRMRRQQVDPVGDAPVAEVASRLAGVQAQVASAAALSVAVRQRKPRQGQVQDALVRDRSVLRTWSMRGTLHLLAADEAPAYLAMSGAHRKWETGAWRKTFKASPEDLDAMASAATEALDGGEALTREQLTEQIVDRTGSDHLAELLGSGWGPLLKPLAWRGVLCNGPSDGGRVTFVSPRAWLPAWNGMPELADAAPIVLRAFLRAHGPATPTTFDAWLSRGGTKKGLLKGWFAQLADELTEVEVDGEPMSLLAEDADNLQSTKPSKSVVLLGGFDAYVLGAGTTAEYLLPKEHRAKVSRPGGWISPVVLHGGRIAGVWEPGEDGPEVSLWDDVPAKPLQAARERMTSLLAATPQD